MNAVPALLGDTLWLAAAMLLPVGGCAWLAWWYRALYRDARAGALLYRNSIAGLSEGFFRCTLDGRMISTNPALLDIVGYDDEATFLDSIKDCDVGRYVDPNRRKDFRILLGHNGLVTNFVSEIYDRHTGGRKWICENARLVSDPRSGRPLYYEGSMADVTEAVHKRQAEERLEKLADNLPGGLFQLCCDSDGKFTSPYLSHGFRKLFSLNPHEEIRPNEYLCRIHPDHLQPYLESLAESRANRTVWKIDFRLVDEDGSERWIAVVATPEAHEDGSLIWHGHVQDISDRKAAEAKISHLAYYDALTNLPNRTLFQRHLEKTLASTARSRGRGAVLFLDIDNFKLLNDTHGHDKGDELLKEVANRLTSIVRCSDTVSRFGGDEFVILLDQIGATDDEAIQNASFVANKIIADFARSFDLANVRQSSSPSIGIVVFDGSEPDPQSIIKCADIAMYEAKKDGRNGYVVFDPGKSTRVSNLYTLQSHLSQAIRNDELEIHYQPQVDERGNIIAAEALVRWRHPELGLLMPGDFVPLAEQSGLIHELNEHVLCRSVQQLGQWQNILGDKKLQLSVNVSAQQLISIVFAETIRCCTEKYDVDPSQLTLEITEHMIARDADLLAERMRQIKKLGIRFSLDDFGTGYSSLSRLNELPVDEVKIDGSFVTGIEESKSARSLIEAILGMARALGLDTVAEHVNTDEQERFLLARGCRRFQGYAYSPPITADEFIALVGDDQMLRLAG